MLKRYTFFAIGEILLVVIGILLAIQIDNWYEAKKNIKQEQIILKNLMKEQNLNKNQIELKIEACRERIQIDSILLETINSKEPDKDIDELARMLGAISSPITFDPANGVMKDLILSSKINLIRDEELRLLISEWESNLAEVKEAEQFLMDLSIIPIHEYLIDKIAMRNAYKEYVGKSELSQNSAIIMEIEFENLVVNSLLNLKLLEDRYLMIRSEIDKMNTSMKKMIQR